MFHEGCVDVCLVKPEVPHLFENTYFRFNEEHINPRSPRERSGQPAAKRRAREELRRCRTAAGQPPAERAAAFNRVEVPTRERRLHGGRLAERLAEQRHMNYRGCGCTAQTSKRSKFRQESCAGQGEQPAGRQAATINVQT